MLPTLSVVTLSPSFSIIPTLSCPSIIGVGTQGTLPEITCMSVPQIPALIILANIAPSSGSGLGNSFNSRGSLGVLKTAANTVILIFSL